MNKKESQKHINFSVIEIDKLSINLLKIFERFNKLPINH